MTQPRFPLILAPRLLAGFGTLTLIGAICLASSRPAHTAGGPIAVTVANSPLSVTTSPQKPVEVNVLVVTNTVNNLVYTVPAGKELVVKSMTLFGGGGHSNGYIGLVSDEDSAGNIASFAALTTPASISSDVAVVTQPMSFTVASGGSVRVDLYLRDSSSFNAYVSLSGTLVDAS